MLKAWDPSSAPENELMQRLVESQVQVVHQDGQEIAKGVIEAEPGLFIQAIR